MLRRLIKQGWRVVTEIHTAQWVIVDVLGGVVPASALTMAISWLGEHSVSGAGNGVRDHIRRSIPHFACIPWSPCGAPSIDSRSAPPRADNGPALDSCVGLPTSLTRPRFQTFYADIPFYCAPPDRIIRATITHSLTDRVQRCRCCRSAANHWWSILYRLLALTRPLLWLSGRRVRTN
jgi:hypothetical protein